MLLEFSVSNFMSFKDRTTLSMVPSIQSNKNVFSFKNVKILKYAAVYGANASGKSNLIKAFSVMVSIIQGGMKRMPKTFYCRLEDKNKLNPSTFSVTYLVNDRFYNYTFTINFFEGKVISETLSEINPKTDKSKELFSYSRGKSAFKEVFNLNNVETFDKSRIDTYLFDISKVDTHLLITELINKEWENKKFSFISDFRKWISSVTINLADQPIRDMRYLEKHEDRVRVSNILNELNTGIVDISSVDLTKEEFIQKTKKDFAEETIRKIQEKYEEMKKTNENENSITLMITGDAYFTLTYSKEGLVIKTMKLTHMNCESDFEYGDESEGTRRLLNLFDILFTSQKNSVYVIDEIERSLHPVLSYKLFEILNKELEAQNIQIIFTTHETHIMDLDLFRKDEIWFMEKNNRGESNLYSLDIFKTRNEKIIKDGYINGLYGGVPLFKKIGV